VSILLVVILGIVQGITEFLPVSSSGHLVVAQELLTQSLGKLESPLAFDISLHLATVIAVMIFLRKDIYKTLTNVFKSGEAGSWSRQLAICVVLATLPAGIIGVLFKDKIEELFASTSCALNGFIATAFILEVAHRFQVKVGNLKDTALSNWSLPSYAQAVIIGFAQAIAILPGVSRSGCTIASALMLGIVATSAVRFSFFLLIPVVLGAVALDSKELLKIGLDEPTGMFVGFLVTFVVASFALRWLLQLVTGAKLRYFAIYAFSISLILRFFL
jgi:undecaprenyl-diphosphatase